MATTSPNANYGTRPPPANPLVAMLANVNKSSLTSVGSLIGRYGLQGLLLLARAYLGPLANRATLSTNVQPDGATAGATRTSSLSTADTAMLGLATAKLAFEVGELALHNPEVRSDGYMPEFKLDEAGRAPALSLMHFIAAVRWWQTYTARRTESYQTTNTVDELRISPSTTLMSARAARYASSPRYSYATVSTTPTTGASMTKSTSRGCSSCGGSSHGPPAPSTPPTSGCQCGSPKTCTCGPRLPTTHTYDSSKCPTFAISCETKTALRDCLKIAVCDFLRAVSETLCPGGQFDSNVFNDPNLGKNLIDDVGQLACSFIHCVPDALCGPTCDTAPAADCVPCDYAVEVQQ